MRLSSEPAVGAAVSGAGDDAVPGSADMSGRNVDATEATQCDA